VDLSHLFGLAQVPPAEPRYNIAPTQTVFAVRADAAGKWDDDAAGKIVAINDGATLAAQARRVASFRPLRLPLLTTLERGLI
jgi:hypothetical protein